MDAHEQNLSEERSSSNVMQFPQFVLQAACMTRIMEGDTESNLYEMIQCVNTILKSDSVPGDWNAQAKSPTSDADVPTVDFEPNVPAKCEPGDSPDFVHGMIVEHSEHNDAAMPIQSGVISGSLNFVNELQHCKSGLPADIEPMSQESEPIPLSLMINPLMTDGVVQISNPISTMECEKITVEKQLNEDQLTEAQMDTFDADDIESLSGDEEPVTMVVEAQVHREPSPYMDQKVQKKKSVSFDLSNIEIIPTTNKIEDHPADVAPQMPVNASDLIQASPISVAEQTVKVPLHENPLECQTPFTATHDITPRSSKSPDNPSYWYPRRLDFVEGSVQFQAMVRGIDKLCGLLQTSRAENTLQAVTKTLILCEKATSPDLPKLTVSKVEQYSISSEMVPAPIVPQSNKFSRSTQTNFSNLSKSQVVIESFPPRHNVDSSDESSDIPSTTVSTNSPVMDRINNDFDVSSESEPEPDQSNVQPLFEMDSGEDGEDRDEGLGHENEDYQMQQAMPKSVRSKSDEDEEDFEQQIKEIMEHHGRVTRSMPKKNDARSKSDEEDEAFGRLISNIISQLGKTNVLESKETTKKSKSKPKKSTKHTNANIVKVPITRVISRSEPKQTTMSQFLKPVQLQPPTVVKDGKPEMPMEVINLDSMENIRPNSQPTSTQSVKQPNTQKRLENDLRMNYYGPDYDTASEVIDGTPQPDFVSKRMQPTNLNGREAKEKFTKNWLDVHWKEGFIAPPPPNVEQPTVARPKSFKRKANTISESGSEATTEKFNDGRFVASTPLTPSVIEHTFVKPTLPARKAYVSTEKFKDCESIRKTNSRAGFMKNLLPRQEVFFRNFDAASIDAVLKGQLTLSDIYEEIADRYITPQAPPNVNVMNMSGANVFSTESQLHLSPGQFKSIHFISGNKFTHY